MSRKSVTIGICAYNEGENIKNLLDSVVLQKETSEFFIKNIIVVSDGSTDNMEQIVLQYDDPRVSLKFFPTREGKPTRMNYLLSLNQSDIVVFLDADIVLEKPSVIKYLVSPLIHNQRVGLVGGRLQPLPAETFVEAAINNYIDARIAIEDLIDVSKTAYCIHGSIMAISKKLASEVVIPHSIFSDGAYLYLFAKKRQYEIRYAKKAVALYRSPQTVMDGLRQAIRQYAGMLQLYNYFLKKYVDTAFALPLYIVIRMAFYQWISNPVGYVFFKCLHYVAWKEGLYRFRNMSVRWNIIRSSKMIKNVIQQA
jgi:glycosyltransferase involved in cell wall biosynthesis